MSEENDLTGAAPNASSGEMLELERMKRPQLAEVAAHYGVTVVHNMSNVALIAAIKTAAGYKLAEDRSSEQLGGQSGDQPREDAPAEEPTIEYVMMRRTTDGDGPHPIHPDEVENYKRGEWVVVEQSQQ